MICRLLVKKVSHFLGSFFVSSSLQSYSGVAVSVAVAVAVAVAAAAAVTLRPPLN
jgi:hypothetical protein